MQPDYNYHNSPDLIQGIIAGLGGIGEVLTFCQTHSVHVEPTADWQYGCVIDRQKPFRGYHAIELDAFSALVLGIHNYKARLDTDSNSRTHN